MELSATALRQVTYSSFSGGFGGDAGSHEVALQGGRVRVWMGPRRVMGYSGFSDEGHVMYYSPPRCGLKEKGSAVLSAKKKLKMLKGFSKSLSLFNELGFDLDPQKRALLDDLQGNLTTDGVELLMTQLEQARAEEKEMKKQMKLEKKDKLKASKMRNAPDCESSSSSSSESSESECDEVVDMDSLRAPPVDHKLQPTMLSPPPLLPHTTVVENPQEDATSHHDAMDQLCSRNDTCVTSISASFKNETSLFTTVPQKRIEVCMGNKCKKSGAAALLRQFERVVGVEVGAVVGCKCMGKCKSGPNVRIQNSVGDSIVKGLNDSVNIPANPLCIGVGLEDVDTIVARFLGENQGDMGMAASAT